MANKDFFDEEFEKLESESTQRSVNADNDPFAGGAPYSSPQGDNFSSWSSHQAPKQEQTSARKPLYIVLICLALVMCIGLGSVLTIIFSSIAKTDQQKLLDKVINILNNDFYEEISDEKMWEAVEAAGTALLQTGGDRYSRLMSPSTYYNYRYGATGDLSNPNGEFGMSFQFVEGIGMYVLSIKNDSSAYGRLEEYDFIVKLENINGENGVTLLIKNELVNFSELVLTECSEDLAKAVMALTNSATFCVLRNGEITKYDMSRKNIGYVNENYEFDYVEFYFDDEHTNVSTHSLGATSHYTKQERRLDLLPADTGYIRLTEFAGDDKDPQAYTEFKSAMALFKELGLKHLVLDLKGNPGGNVYIAQEIAGLLITDKNLSDSDKKKVRKGQELLVTTLEFRSGDKWSYSVPSAYDEYFTTGGDKCDIAVWTDSGSASASELLTGTLLDYKTAVHMGTKSFGKGIAQVIQPLNGFVGTFVQNGVTVTENWAIYYTAAKYYPPLSGNIHENGYTPSDNYNNLNDYADLWAKTAEYFRTGIQV